MTDCPCCGSPWVATIIRSYDFIAIDADFAMRWQSDIGGVITACRASDGFIYTGGQVGTRGGLCKSKSDTGAIVWGLSPSAGRPVFAVAVDASGNIATGTDDSTAHKPLRVYSPSKALYWEDAFGAGTSAVYGLAYDSSNNIYAAGGGFLHGGSSFDGYVIKYSQSGTQLWQASYGNSFGGVSGDCRAYAIATDGSTVTVVGRVAKRVSSLDSLCTTHQYDSSGSLLWSYNSGAALRGVAYLSDGTVVTCSELDTVSGQSPIRAHDSSGTVLWTTDFVKYAYSIAVDASDNIYVGGSRNATTTVAKYDSSGALLDSFDYKLRQPGSGLTPTVYCVTVDSSGNVYMGGDRVIL